MPWAWIIDEGRTIHVWRYARTVGQYLANELDEARIDLWAHEPPPLIVCESRATSGVLEREDEERVDARAVLGIADEED